jgi:hypothetical protein
MLSVGCSHPAFGPSGDERLSQAVKEGASTAPTAVTNEDIEKQRCGDYRKKLEKAHREDASEEERLDAYMAVFKELKEKNEYLEKALSSNPDLQFQNEGTAPKFRDECVAALADVRTEYYAFLSEISEVLVVTDVKGKAAPRLDFKKYREAVTILDPDDRDSFFSKIDSADRKIKAAKESPQ